MSRVAPILLALISLLTASCISSPDVLRLVEGDSLAHQQVARLLGNASELGSIGVPIEVVGPPATPGEALERLERGDAELAIIENSLIYYRASARTVVPLYSSVLHIAKRQGRSARTVKELLDGATVFAGPEDAPARLLLNYVLSLFSTSGIDITFVDSVESQPDVLMLFAPIAPARASIFRGYELFSLGTAADGGAGSLADALGLIVPQLRRFVIPMGTYGERTPEPIVTVAIDTVLVAASEVPRVAIFDLVRGMRALRPTTITEMPELLLPLDEDFGNWRYAFPLHAGTQTFLTSEEPEFYERAAGILDTVMAVVVGLLTGSIALFRYLRSRRKNRIDELYEKVLAIRAEHGATLTADERKSSIVELVSLRDDAYRQLIDEKLEPNENFAILMKLIDDVLAELRFGNDHDRLGDAQRLLGPETSA